MPTRWRPSHALWFSRCLPAEGGFAAIVSLQPFQTTIHGEPLCAKHGSSAYPRDRECMEMETVTWRRILSASGASTIP
jgi:hypothetical protein